MYLAEVFRRSVRKDPNQAGLPLVACSLQDHSAPGILPTWCLHSFIMSISPALYHKRFPNTAAGCLSEQLVKVQWARSHAGTGSHIFNSAAHFSWAELAFCASYQPRRDAEWASNSTMGSVICGSKSQRKNQICAHFLVCVITQIRKHGITFMRKRL